MTAKNEALRIFLAVTAIILTALLTGPVENAVPEKKQRIIASKPVKGPIKTIKFAMRERR